MNHEQLGNSSCSKTLPLSVGEAFVTRVDSDLGILCFFKQSKAERDVCSCKAGQQETREENRSLMGSIVWEKIE